MRDWLRANFLSFAAQSRGGGGLPFFLPRSPFPISAGITFVGGLSATSICRLEVGTIRKASSRTKSLRENRPSLPPLTTITLSLSLFRARARFWRNCFFVLAFPPFDPRFPDSSSFSSFYPSPVCPIAIVRDESRVEKKKRKEKEGGKIFKCSLVRSLVILVVCLYVVIIVLPREGV